MTTFIIPGTILLALGVLMLAGLIVTDAKRIYVIITAATLAATTLAVFALSLYYPTTLPNTTEDCLASEDCKIRVVHKACTDGFCRTIQEEQYMEVALTVFLVLLGAAVISIIIIYFENRRWEKRMTKYSRELTKELEKWKPEDH
jgi:hypothetical protein